MQGREASKATTIMQKFIKGSSADHIPPMPVVIGMSATTQRFNALVEGTSSTIHKSIVTTDEVRASGLLKDRIVITYPEESAVNNDMAILQAAADDWKEKANQVKGYVIVCLKEAGVIKASISNDSIAKVVGVMEKSRSFSKYIGKESQEQPYAGWVLKHVDDYC